MWKCTVLILDAKTGKVSTSVLSQQIWAKSSYFEQTGAVYHCCDLHSFSISTWDIWMLFALTTANIVSICRHKNKHICTHNASKSVMASLNINTLILQTILLNSIIRKAYLGLIKPFQYYVIWRLFSIGTFCQSASQQIFFRNPIRDAHVILLLTFFENTLTYITDTVVICIIT